MRVPLFGEIQRNQVQDRMYYEGFRELLMDANCIGDDVKDGDEITDKSWVPLTMPVVEQIFRKIQLNFTKPSERPYSAPFWASLDFTQKKYHCMLPFVWVSLLHHSWYSWSTGSKNGPCTPSFAPQLSVSAPTTDPVPTAALVRELSTVGEPTNRFAKFRLPLSNLGGVSNQS